MKILITLPYTKGRGGIETVVTKLLNSSFSEENQITLLIRSKEYSAWLDDLPSRIIIKTMPFGGNNKVFRMGSYLWQILCQRHYDYVIDAGIKSLSVLKKLRAILKQHFKIISWPHFSLTIYQDKIHYFKDADYFWAISHDLKKELLTLGIEERRIYLVYNPVETHQSLISKTKKDEEIKFVYVGRLVEEQKNLLELFAALGGVENYQLHIYGDGIDRAMLEEESLKQHLNIIFHGWNCHPWDDIKIADYLISTSNYEGFGMSISEAITHGVPVISSNCPVGPNDLVKDGINGYLYQLHNVDQLHQILKNCSKRMYHWDDAIIQNSLNSFGIENYIHHIQQSFKFFEK